MAEQVIKVRTINQKALRNVITHVEISNRAKEEREMWRNHHKKNKERDKSPPRKTKKRKKEQQYNDEDADGSKKSSKKRKKARKLNIDDLDEDACMEILKLKEPVVKWGHDGYEEMYKNNKIQSDTSSSETPPKKSKKKKKHKRKKRKHKE